MAQGTPPPIQARVGQRLRELRLARGHAQAELARRLGISPAYLNLIEKGRRTLQLPLLWRALELLEVEPEPFIASLGEGPLEERLARLLDEPLLRTLNLGRDELGYLSAEPLAVTTITTLFNLYKNTRSQLESALASLALRERAEPGADTTAEATLRFDHSPFDEVADFVQRARNTFPEVEEATVAARREGGLGARVHADELVALLERLGVTVRLLPERNAGSVVRRFDPETQVLEISGRLSEARRKFELAHTVGLHWLDRRGLEAGTFAGLVTRHAETPRLIKVHLANTFAGALLMPYQEFFESVQRTRYDVERLAEIWEQSYESVAHRITNLGDPRRRGVPMHFLRVDIAGNISKRTSQTGLMFPSGLGSCPKWAAHTAFLTPSAVTRQYSVMPDGTAYFCFARVTSHPIRGSLVKGTVYSIGLGTHAEDARYLAYADDLPRFSADRAGKIAVPVGVTCRLCERPDCNQRAAPSYRFAVSPDEYVKKDNFFSPLLGREVQRPRPREE